MLHVGVYHYLCNGILELHYNCSIMTILIDPGHGNNTAGKRSPDGSYLEYSFNREIAHRLCCAINSLPSLNSLTSPTSLTLSAQVIVPELEDISLLERCNRVNEICRTIGTENVLLISIHAMQQAMDRSGARLPDGAATPALAGSKDYIYDLFYHVESLWLPNRKLMSGCNMKARLVDLVLHVNFTCSLLAKQNLT